MENENIEKNQTDKNQKDESRHKSASRTTPATKIIIAIFAFLMIAALVGATAFVINRANGSSGDLSKLNKGDTVTFGRYEQDGDGANGPEDIEWVVLEKIDDELLLLSSDCLDCRAYNNKAFEPITWEKSEIRKWLNGYFYDNTFSEDEKKHVMEMENKNDDQVALGTNGGNDTLDKVFFLSEKEVGIYMGDEINQTYLGQACATAFAISHGAKVDETGMTQWWLRSPGGYEYSAQFVENSGALYNAGAYVDIAYAIRPAIWVKTKVK